jgi:hypothetical protein
LALAAPPIDSYGRSVEDGGDAAAEEVRRDDTMRLTLVGITVLAALTPSPVALAGHGRADHHPARGCARRDMESFRGFDAATWRDGYDPDAVSIFPSGATFAGLDAIMDALAGHFADRSGRGWS